MSEVIINLADVKTVSVDLKKLARDAIEANLAGGGIVASLEREAAEEAVSIGVDAIVQYLTKQQAAAAAQSTTKPA